nr:8067_t:CDS:2 [Entrophospora candida]
MSTSFILENVFGLIGAIFWSFQLAPQAYKNWHNKNTKGLSPLMMLLWTISGLMFGIYAVVLDLSIPLILQPQLFLMISFLCYAQCLYYDQSKIFIGRKLKIVMFYVVGSLILGGIQVAGIFGIRESNKHNVKWPEVLVGILSVVLLTSGFMMQFIEIYRIKLVRGVSLIFLTIDMLGSVFSIVSLVFRPPPFDLLASFTYVSVLVCDVVIIILYYLLNWIDSRRCHENSLKEELGDNTVTMSNDRRNLNQKEKINSEVQE